MRNNRAVMRFWAVLAIMSSLVSCAKEIAIDGEGTETTNKTDKTTTKEANSSLTVQTRATSADGETISYPVTIYVFDENGECAAVNTIAEGETSATMALAAGDYTVCAVGGADATAYTLPTQDEATQESILSLNDGQSHGDLMAMTGTAVTLSKDNTNTLDISLSRKVNMVQSVKISDLPTTTTAVTLTLSPLYGNINLNGEYDGTSRQSLSLEKQTDGTWALPSPAYIMPATGAASISLSIVAGSTTTTYNYDVAESLTEPNHKLNISGTYDDGIIELTGTIKGAVWSNDINIDFTFTKDNISSEEGGGTIDPSIPARGTFYNNNTCFVVDSVDNGNGHVTLTLMSIKDQNLKILENYTQDDIKSKVESIIESMKLDEIEGSTGWSLPSHSTLLNFNTIEIYNSLRTQYKAVTFALAMPYLFINSNGVIKQGIPENSFEESDLQGTVHVRAFTTITLTRGANN